MGNVNDLHELQTRSVFRGRAASFADAQRLSRLRQQPRKQTAIMACSAPQGKPYGSNQTSDARRLFAPTAFPKKALIQS